MLAEDEWKRIKRYVERNREAALEKLSVLIGFPTVAHPTEKNQVLTECASVLVQWLKDLGSRDARTITDYLHPLVVGSITSDPSKPTILIYGHFDVQDPGNLDAWKTPPFESTLRDGKIFGRGSGDNKGQFLSHFLAVEAYRCCGIELPVNLNFILDGGEEIGSDALRTYAATSPEQLKGDIVFAADSSVHESGRPMLVLGMRGIAYLRILVRTLRRPAHSHYAPVLPSAAWRAMEILNSLHDDAGNITVSGFHDEVVPPTPEDMNLLRNIPPARLDQLTEEFSPSPPLKRLSSEEYYRRMLMDPVLNVAGLAVGDLHGNQTVLADSALIKLEAGLVPNQRADEVFDKIRNHLALQGVDPTDVELVFAMEPSRTPPDHSLIEPMTRALERVWDAPPVVMNRFSSYGPGYIFEQLGLPAFYTPYAQPDESNHAPNEKLSLENFENGILTTIAVIDEVGHSLAA